jgi:hypothetical protein
MRICISKIWLWRSSGYPASKYFNTPLCNINYFGAKSVQLKNDKCRKSLWLNFLSAYRQIPQQELNVHRSLPGVSSPREDWLWLLEWPQEVDSTLWQTCHAPSYPCSSLLRACSSLVKITYSPLSDLHLPPSFDGDLQDLNLTAFGGINFFLMMWCPCAHAKKYMHIPCLLLIYPLSVFFHWPRY